ncbi:MAG: hypothetical protein WCI37_03305 [bacterium]
MYKINGEMLKKELGQSLTKPFRLPINLVIAAIGTLAFIFAGILINNLHRGLPYIAANIFIWTLATYNASQLGSDSNNVIAYLKTKKSIKQLFLIKNLSLLILAFPIDIVLIIVACDLLHDWSEFVQSIVIGLSAVVICLGLGNIVSTLWVYSPTPFMKIRHDRVKMFDYSVFLILAYSSATFSLLIASLPVLLIIDNLNNHKFPGNLISLVIMVIWTIAIWLITLKISIHITSKYSDRFFNKLSGQPLNIKNLKLRKILKIK